MLSPPPNCGAHTLLSCLIRLQRKISLFLKISTILKILPEGPQTTRGTGPDILYTDYNITKKER